MQKLTRILSVVDPAAAVQPALHRAAWLATRTGAKLDLLICHYDEYLVGDRLFDSHSLHDARQAVLDGFVQTLELLAAPLRHRGLDVTATAIWNHPEYEGIARHAEQTGAGIVFKGTEHHSALARALLRNADWALIRACHVPLWLVKPIAFPEKPLFIAAIDPMNEHDKPAALDDEILCVGNSLASLTGAELQVFHSYDPRTAAATAMANAYIPVSLPLAEIEREMRLQHEIRFREITGFHRIPRDKRHLVRGLAYQELPALAKKLDASVVIMGAVARNRLERLFIGATAERALEHLPCDLLIVKPDWASGSRSAPREVA
ncbi:MAG TPA: universal stress protein [Woeseiaceae bacterium]|nr:universal stress protein [Woeseiaceae bacterium]